jgi:putative salt-induced outer membrane protein
MTRILTLATVSAVAVSLGAPVFAQTTLIGDQVLEDRISDIEIAAQRNIARSKDSARYTFGAGEQSTTGSLSATYSGATGNTDTQDFAAGGRYSMRFGPWSHSIGFAFAYGEANKIKNEENAFMIYDVTRSFSDRFYLFGVGRLEVDHFASNKKDAFVGFGPGYRLINTDDVAWRVQAGVGPRYTELQNGTNDTQAAGIISSRLFYRISDTVALTNDTDILGSKVNTLVTNDIGINFAMGEQLSTRLGYRTEYDSDPLPGLKHTDNTLNVSLIYSFN